MSHHERARAVAAAETILSRGGWCVLEVRADARSADWETRTLIFDVVAEAVADAIEEEIQLEPAIGARLTGCSRITLDPDPSMGAEICYLAGEAVC